MQLIIQFNILKIANDWEMIESKELAKVALGRISAIEKLEQHLEGNAKEVEIMQPFFEKFPWILNPRITTFEREVSFSTILKKNFPDQSLGKSNRRIDFLCSLT
ncbi:MAG: ATP-binding protein, partial [Tissierellia bacterium]|nr:ATP-binding protein [Tissierellia bacterium]